MKCTITIETSDYTDLKALIGMIIALPAPVSIVSAPINPEIVTVTLKDPDTGESHVITRRHQETLHPDIMPVRKEQSPKKVVEPRCHRLQIHLRSAAKNAPKFSSPKVTGQGFAVTNVPKSITRLIGMPKSMGIIPQLISLKLTPGLIRKSRIKAE